MNRKTPATLDAEPKPLTGRMVLLCLVAFFGVVASVNAIMIGAATSTFGGIERSTAYKTGLAFRNEMEAARRQDARGWQVSAHAERSADGEAVVDVVARDSTGRPLGGLQSVATLSHPAFSRLDRSIPLAPSGAGRFVGRAPAAEGHWDLVVEIFAGEERLFRSRSRIVLR